MSAVRAAAERKGTELRLTARQQSAAQNGLVLGTFSVTFGFNGTEVRRVWQLTEMNADDRRWPTVPPVIAGLFVDGFCFCFC